ncbi:MAG: hypothetical protein WD512_17045 [Candidatus Paceibacterota bacterium]
MSIKYKTPSKKELEHLHYDLKFGRKDLERKYNVSGPVIDRWFNEHNMKFFGRKERSRPTKKELEHLHYDLKYSFDEISNYYNRGVQYIKEWFDFYQIKRIYHKRKRKIQLDYNIFYNLHIIERKTFKEISVLYNVSDALVGIWYKELNIKNQHFNIKYGKTEEEIEYFLNQNGFNFKKNRNILNGKELDFYDSTLKIAIEYCGLRWHSSKFKIDKNYHYNKFLECEKQGIHLVTIFEDEWIEKEDIIKSILLNKCGKIENIISARKCEIVKNDPNIRLFLKENHLQGAPNNITNSICLKYNNEIVGCITLGKHHRDGSKKVLSRLCFLKNTKIIGGAQRLFKNLDKVDNIITWSDNRWYSGKIYNQLGFKYINDIKPDYSYCKSQTRKSKQSCKKSIIGCPKDIKEESFMKQKDWYKIWDCGKKTYLYEI